MKGESSDIGFVVEGGLCTGCGTCAGICPAGALSMEIDRKKGIYLPRLNREKCTACGLCVSVCPGHEVDFEQLNREVFGRQPEDILLGNYLGCYTGHAADPEIRYNCSSGGLVTALLIHALEQGMINGALVTKMNPERPLEPLPFIARTREEIYEARGSKYCPVPANTALAEILKAPPGERFAVVGLPCHIHGLRKAELAIPKLKERVALRLGIFCWHTASFDMTDYQINKLGIEKEEICNIEYRGGGWPGRFGANTLNGDRVSIAYHSFIELHAHYFFTPERCRLCLEQTAELADISLGDAWLPEIINNDNAGASIIIARTDCGRGLLAEAEKTGIVSLERLPDATVRRLEGDKKLDYRARLLFSRVLGQRVPQYKAAIPAPGLSSYIRYFFWYADALTSTRRQTWWLIPPFLQASKALSKVKKLFKK